MAIIAALTVNPKSKGYGNTVLSLPNRKGGNRIQRKIKYNDEIALETEFEWYFATKSGKIISTKVKGGQGSTDILKPREHNYKEDKDGYLECCFSYIDENNTQKRIYRRVHRIVWETFNEKILDDLTVDHIDKNTKNNNLDNLRLLTLAENTSVARKGVKSLKRFFYKVYFHGIYQGTYDRKELKELHGITEYDWYKGNKIKELKRNGYDLVQESVEDIERVHMS